MKKELRIYEAEDGKAPFIEWFESLKDKVVRAHVRSRMTRLVNANYGDFKAVGEGVLECRIHYGAGYRIYFAEHGKEIILLLVGGDKRSQYKDIHKAKAYLKDFEERYYGQTKN